MVILISTCLYGWDSIQQNVFSCTNHLTTDEYGCLRNFTLRTINKWQQVSSWRTPKQSGCMTENIGSLLMINYQQKLWIHIVYTLEMQLPHECCHGNKCMSLFASVPCPLYDLFTYKPSGPLEKTSESFCQTDRWIYLCNKNCFPPSI